MGLIRNSKYFIKTKIIRNYRLISFIIFIFILNKFIIQTIYYPNDNTYQSLLADDTLDNIDLNNDDLSLNCHLATNLNDYLNKTLTNNEQKLIKHDECTKKDWIIVDQFGVCSYNYEYLESINLLIDSCYYSIIFDSKEDFDSSYTIDDQKYELKNGTELNKNYEFFLISCKAYKKNRNIINFPFKYRTAYARILKPKLVINEENKEPINVLFLGLDSISKIGWLNNLPKSSKYLFDELDVNVLNGYNIVGDGTPAAIIALLTGKYEHELPNTSIGTKNANYVDDVYPLLWKNYSNELNYATLFAEDWPTIGTFNYRMIGMSKRPTTHYMRPYQLAIEDEGMLKESSILCLHGRTRLQVMLDYAFDFMRQYYKHGFFGLTFLSDYTHDQSNHIKWVDDILLDFLQKFKNHQLNENTVLILFSDHGPRFSNIRSTIKGLLEERNPFFSFYLPKRFQVKFPLEFNIFKSNLNNFVTPFDVHETLIDLISMLKSGKHSFIPEQSRSLSLFNKISKNRRCSDADVDTHWCACLKRKKLVIDDTTFEIAHKLIEFINNDILLKHTTKCSPLELLKINKVYLLEASNSLRINNKQPIKSNSTSSEHFFYKLIKNFVAPLAKEVEVVTSYEQYQIQLETKPNLAIFETTITVERNFKNQQDYRVNVDQNLISRLNKYGNQSICIHHDFPDLRKYCYCK